MGHRELYGAGSFVLGLRGCNWVVVVVVACMSGCKSFSGCICRSRNSDRAIIVMYYEKD